jgi:carboxymethylenebutenolidase
MPDIDIAGPRHMVPAYLGVPAGDGPWPGVVVLHDAVGQSADNRRQVDWLARAGYVAVAPDLYAWRKTKIICIQATIREMLARSGHAYDDIEAVRAYLAARPDCTGKVGVVGFCMGGGFALALAASGRGFAASNINYGMLPKDLETMLGGACPVIGSFGGRDATLKGAAARLEAALAAQGVAHDVKEYPDAGHSFLNDHGGAWGWVMARVGMGYHAESAEDARARLLRFFSTHLA